MSKNVLYIGVIGLVLLIGAAVYVLRPPAEPSVATAASEATQPLLRLWKLPKGCLRLKQTRWSYTASFRLNLRSASPSMKCCVEILILRLEGPTR